MGETVTGAPGEEVRPREGVCEWLSLSRKEHEESAKRREEWLQRRLKPVEEVVAQWANERAPKVAWLRDILDAGEDD